MKKKFQIVLVFILMLCFAFIMLSCGNEPDAGEIVDPGSNSEFSDPSQDGGEPSDSKTGIQVGSGPLDFNSTDDVLDFEDLIGSENSESSSSSESESQPESSDPEESGSQSESGSSGVQAESGPMPDDDKHFGPVIDVNTSN